MIVRKNMNIHIYKHILFTYVTSNPFYNPAYISPPFLAYTSSHLIYIYTHAYFYITIYHIIIICVYIYILCIYILCIYICTNVDIFYYTKHITMYIYIYICVYIYILHIPPNFSELEPIPRLTSFWEVDGFSSNHT